MGWSVWQIVRSLEIECPLIAPQGFKLYPEGQNQSTKARSPNMLARTKQNKKSNPGSMWSISVINSKFLLYQWEEAGMLKQWKEYTLFYPFRKAVPLFFGALQIVAFGNYLVAIKIQRVSTEQDMIQMRWKLKDYCHRLHWRVLWVFFKINTRKKNTSQEAENEGPLYLKAWLKPSAMAAPPNRRPLSPILFSHSPSK